MWQLPDQNKDGDVSKSSLTTSSEQKNDNGKGGGGGNQRRVFNVSEDGGDGTGWRDRL